MRCNLALFDSAGARQTLLAAASGRKIEGGRAVRRGGGGLQPRICKLVTAPFRDWIRLVDVGVLESQSDVRELLAVMNRRDREEITEANAGILAVVKSLGGSQSRYRREHEIAESYCI